MKLLFYRFDSTFWEFSQIPEHFLRIEKVNLLEIPKQITFLTATFVISTEQDKSFLFIHSTPGFFNFYKRMTNDLNVRKPQLKIFTNIKQLQVKLNNNIDVN